MTFHHPIISAFLLPHTVRLLKKDSTHETNNCRCNRPPSCSIPQVSRRKALQALSLLAVTPYLPADAASKAITLGEKEVGDVYGYSFLTPTGWTRNTAGLSSFRTATVFLCDEDSDSNISMVVTPIPGDFQKLSSFGTLDNVLQTIVPTSNKDISGEVVSTRNDVPNNAYVIEYKVTSKGIARHLLTIFSLQPGRYLLTLTGQAREENWTAREPVIRAVADSYKLQILD